MSISSGRKVNSSQYFRLSGGCTFLGKQTPLYNVQYSASVMFKVVQMQESQWQDTGSTEICQWVDSELLIERVRPIQQQAMLLPEWLIYTDLGGLCLHLMTIALFNMPTFSRLLIYEPRCSVGGGLDICSNCVIFHNYVDGCTRQEYASKYQQLQLRPQVNFYVDIKGSAEVTVNITSSQL